MWLLRELCSCLSMLCPVNQEKCLWQLFQLQYSDFPCFRCHHLTLEELLVARGWRLEQQCSCLTDAVGWNPIFAFTCPHQKGVCCCPPGSLFHVHVYIPAYIHAYIPTCACLMQWRAPGARTCTRKSRNENITPACSLVPLLSCVFTHKNICSVSQLSIYLMGKRAALSLSIAFEDNYVKRWLE